MRSQTQVWRKPFIYIPVYCCVVFDWLAYGCNRNMGSCSSAPRRLHLLFSVPLPFVEQTEEVFGARL